MGERQLQGGWVGLIGILLALAIVLFLAKDALKQYGLMSGLPASTKAGTPGERARSPGAIGVEAFDINSAPSAPTAPMDRARGVEDMVKQQAEQNAKRVDDATR